MFYFPHQGLRFQLLILRSHHVITDSYERRRWLLPFIQISYQPSFPNRNETRLRKDPRCLKAIHPPFLQLRTVFVTGSYCAIGSICSLNPGLARGWGLMTKITGHESVLIKTGLQRGVHYPGAGCKSNRTVIGPRGTGTSALGRSQTCGPLQASSWTSRGWVDEVLLPTELIRTEWSTTMFSWLGLQLAKLE